MSAALVRTGLRAMVLAGCLLACNLASGAPASICPLKLEPPARRRYYVLVDASSSMINALADQTTSLFRKSVEALVMLQSHVALRYPNIDLEISFFYGIPGRNLAPSIAHEPDEHDADDCPNAPCEEHRENVKGAPKPRMFALERATGSVFDLAHRLEIRHKTFHHNHWLTPLYEAIRHVRHDADTYHRAHPQTLISAIILTDGKQEFGNSESLHVQREFKHWPKSSVYAIYLGRQTAELLDALRVGFPDANEVLDLESSNAKALADALEGQLPTLVPETGGDWPDEAVMRIAGTPCVATVLDADEAVTATRCVDAETAVLAGARSFHVAVMRQGAPLSSLHSREAFPTALIRAPLNEGATTGTVGVVVDSSGMLALETDEISLLECHRSDGWSDCKSELLRFLSRRHRPIPLGAPIVESVCSDAGPVWRALAFLTGPNQITPINGKEHRK